MLIPDPQVLDPRTALREKSMFRQSLPRGKCGGTEYSEMSVGVEEGG